MQDVRRSQLAQFGFSGIRGKKLDRWPFPLFRPFGEQGALRLCARQRRKPQFFQILRSAKRFVARVFTFLDCYCVQIKF